VEFRVVFEKMFLSFSEKLFLFAGSVKSLISMPCFMSHASIPAEVREARGLTEDLVRISVGIEDVSDLIADLDNALRTGPL
jgi:cystathionine beta-lyase